MEAEFNINEKIVNFIRTLKSSFHYHSVYTCKTHRGIRSIVMKVDTEKAKKLLINIADLPIVEIDSLVNAEILFFISCLFLNG